MQPAISRPDQAGGAEENDEADPANDVSTLSARPWPIPPLSPRFPPSEETMSAPPSGPVTPVGLNHLVINVRNLEESHRFWTEMLGFKQVGELKKTPERPNPARMRFYSGDHGGQMNHHDIALIENTALPEPPAEWSMNGMPTAIAHIAITLPNREAWLRQLAYLQSKGVKFNRRVEHGMTHSLYINDPNGYGVELLYELPREVWEGDIDAALNFAVPLPTEGEAALEDRTDAVPVFRTPQPAAE
jgi:catechol 2,3-dioxygenase